MIYNTLVFTDAIEHVEKILETPDIDEACDRIERISQTPDLAMACFMLFYMKSKGIDTSHLTGAELANTQPSIANLILPPGVKL
jgi:hypothetical protein